MSGKVHGGIERQPLPDAGIAEQDARRKIGGKVDNLLAGDENRVAGGQVEALMQSGSVIKRARYQIVGDGADILLDRALNHAVLDQADDALIAQHGMHLRASGCSTSIHPPCTHRSAPVRRKDFD